MRGSARVNLDRGARRGFVLKSPHGRADYLLLSPSAEMRTGSPSRLLSQSTRGVLPERQVGSIYELEREPHRLIYRHRTPFREGPLRFLAELGTDALEGSLACRAGVRIVHIAALFAECVGRPE
jgi:hypothetical protein